MFFGKFFAMCRWTLSTKCVSAAVSSWYDSSPTGAVEHQSTFEDEGEVIETFLQFFPSDQPNQLRIKYTQAGSEKPTQQSMDFIACQTGKQSNCC